MGYVTYMEVRIVVIVEKNASLDILEQDVNFVMAPMIFEMA